MNFIIDRIQTTGNRASKKEKGEFDDLPPIEDLKISVPEVLADPMGEVSWWKMQNYIFLFIKIIFDARLIITFQQT